MARPVFKTSGSTISSVSTVIGITLVLVMLGAFTMFLLIADSLSSHIRGQHRVNIFLSDQAPEAEIQRLKQQLQAEPFAQEVTYISREEAALLAQEEIGQDFIEVLGYNPVPASLQLKVHPDFSDTEKLESSLEPIKADPNVDEVAYQKSLMQKINENTARIGLGLLILGVLLLIIAVVLINSTIELAIFSQRFIIKSMQLVGATSWFIQRPFLRRALGFGIVSSILAMAILSLLIFSFREELVDAIAIMRENHILPIAAGAILVAGILVSWISTALAVSRFIRLNRRLLF